MVARGVAKRTVEIPEGVEVRQEEGILTVRKDEITLSRRLVHPRIDVSLKGSTVHVSCVMARKREEALVGTMASHIGNMIRGVTEPFVYTMRVVYAHFPVKVTVQGGNVVIDNFQGERHPRKAKIRGDTKVDVQRDTLTITGPSIEDVSQTAANIEQATRIKNKDPRVFQDGIYLIGKGGG